MNRRLRNRSGSNAMEFALTLPVFIGLMFALIDFGWYFANNAILDIAVHAGCREASLVDPVTGDFATAAQTKMQEIIDIVPQSCSSNCVIEIDDVGVVPARSVSCTITATHKPFVDFWPTPTELSSATLVRFEWQRAI